MHSSTSPAHPTIAKRHGLDEYHRWLVWHIQQPAQQVFHIFNVFQDPFVVDRQLDRDQV